jgi:hypothetical protein
MQWRQVRNGVGFEVLAAVTISITVWDMLAAGYLHVRITVPF